MPCSRERQGCPCPPPLRTKQRRGRGLGHTLTFSSPEATLKASSTRQPTAMRTALEECISFHTVSLSTCGGRRAGFSVPPAGGGQEWGWAPGQWAQQPWWAGKAGQELGEPPTHPISRYPTHPNAPARQHGVHLLTDGACIEEGQSYLGSWGPQRVASSMPEKGGQTQAKDRPLWPAPARRGLCSILGRAHLTSGADGKKKKGTIREKSRALPYP